jgi:hypothetical protein
VRDLSNDLAAYLDKQIGVRPRLKSGSDHH